MLEGELVKKLPQLFASFRKGVAAAIVAWIHGPGVTTTGTVTCEGCCADRWTRIVAER